ncbi:FAS1 domain-containing protein [Cercophora newfieldiana]|uniref:FAS1 domain-containing protein n=1 Tax=Cercophora newfieldiana TaxID=92897 RepID=A0AA39YBW4_9PEZI|nr:FAS1 domain-containing protein [Cercophora newfieldiana]
MLSSLPSPRATFSAVAAMLVFAPAFSHAQHAVRDLASVLAVQEEMVTFRALVKRFPDVFSGFPKEGVTIIAPNDFAFSKVGNWGHKTTEATEAALKYHVITTPINTGSIGKGNSMIAATTLTDPAFTNVTGGQQLILTKQPGGEVVLTSGFATRGTIVVEDIAFDGGIVQIVDSVMRVPETLESTARNAYTDLTAFLGALHRTHIADEILTAKDVTILAPRNAAFQQLAGVLSHTTPSDLRRILHYHIVPDLVLHSWELQNGSFLVSAEQSRTMEITRLGNYIFVNSAQFLQTDILLSNGLVQMVDNILSPDHTDARPDITATAQLPVLTPSGATATGTKAPIPFTSDLPCTSDCPETETFDAKAPRPTGAPASPPTPDSAPSRNSGLVGIGLGVCLAAGALVVGI